MKKVAFGFVNCNRLHYLQSCVESMLECTSDYSNKEFVIVDNASVEAGTKDYLRQKEQQGFKIVRQPHRDPNNEFAIGLNAIVSNSDSEFICPIQGDTQFVLRGGWLKKYVDLYSQDIENIGCMTFDAQRRITISNRKYSKITDGFLIEHSKPPVLGAGDVMYSRKVLEKIGPWRTKNIAHEGGGDFEGDLYERVKAVMSKTGWSPYAVGFVLPVSIGIYTDARGTHSRVRGNKRYGDYWPPKESFTYYKIQDFSDAFTDEVKNLERPLSIEQVAKPIGWNAPIDLNGSWKKNPIRPETAQVSDYTVLYEDVKIVKSEDNYLNDWLSQ